MEPVQKNVLQSTVLAQHKKVRPIPKMCWRNASRVILHVPEYEDATYVEGVIVDDRCGLVIEHGWVEHQNEVLDPTLPDDPYIYFPGLRFQGRTELCNVIQTIPKHKGDPPVPLFFRFGWGGNDSLEMCQAWDDAWAYACDTGLVRGHRPPSWVELWKRRKDTGR